MLVDEIRKANIEAMKARDNVAKAVCTLLISDYKNLQMQRGFEDKTVSDVDMISLIQKLVKDLKESVTAYNEVGNKVKAEEIIRQIAIAQSFLPKMLTEEEIKNEIIKLDDKSIGNVMKHFKANFSGKCDFSLVQKVFKEI